MQKVYQIRYRVYCEEFQYEPPILSRCQETDEFDATSSHCLVMHKATGMPAGCARLVQAGETL